MDWRASSAVKGLAGRVYHCTRNIWLLLRLLRPGALPRCLPLPSCRYYTDSSVFIYAFEGRVVNYHVKEIARSFSVLDAPLRCKLLLKRSPAADASLR